ncbi:IMPACT family protein [Natronomonas sp. EA1]|uniref:IMPACT family protein n=1 Tax=Natronomonas sp. EA1 TaxID=3421655 RepID=UPI003EC0C1CE
MTTEYRTLAGPARTRFVVQGSEFIGHARPVETVDDAEAFIAEVEAEYADATHNVPAYRVRVGDGSLGGGMLREYSNDDGEPSGSAGKPMLNVLQGRELENVAVVVTRYYGGTNLGVGGLVRAYSKSVKDAIAEAGVVTEVPHERFVAEVEYDDSGTVRGILESQGVAFEAAYDATVSFEVRVPTADAEGLRDRLRSATNGRIEIE